MDQHTYSVLFEREISIWKRDEWTGKIHLAKKFDSMKDFFQCISGGYSSNWANFVTFGNNFDDHQTYGLFPFDRKRYWNLNDNVTLDKNKFIKNFYCYLCYDCFDKHYSQDRLIGLYRIWRNNPTRRRRRGWLQHGWNRSAYGTYRYPHSTQEIRWAEAWDDEEFAPKKGFARRARRMRNLPNAWDDELSHNDKCWKTQSKRKHQWKPKSK